MSQHDKAPFQVNGYDVFLWEADRATQKAEVYLEIDPKLLEASQGRVYLRLRDLGNLAAWLIEKYDEHGGSHGTNNHD